MSELILWKQQEIDRMRHELEDLFRRFRKDFGVPRFLFEESERLRFRLTEDARTLTLQAVLPGFEPGDIEITVDEETLTFSGRLTETRTEGDDNHRRVVQSTRAIARSIALPCRIDPEDVKASFAEETLTIVLPKCRPKAARTISISTAPHATDKGA